VQELNDDVWKRFTTETGGFRNAVKDAGVQLADLAANDLPGAQKAFRLLTDGQNLSEKQLVTLLETMPEYREALIDIANAQGINISATDEAAANTALLKLAQGDGAKASTEAADAYLDAANEADGLTDTLDSLIAKMNEANGVGQDAVSSNLDYQNALFEVDEQIRKAREGVDGFSLGMGQNTQVGRDNMAMLNDLAGGYQKAAEDQFALDGNTENYVANLRAGRDAVLQRARDLGATDEQIQYLSDTIVQMPSEKEIKIIADTQTALKTLDNFITTASGRRINIPMFLTPQAQQGIKDNAWMYQADGGKVNFYADGGRENHIAQFARAGTTRVWAEPETGGEWYIPAAPAKRGRSTQVLAEAADEFGYTLTPKGGQSFGDGGRSGSQPASSGRSGPREIVGKLELVGGTAWIRGYIKDELGGF
jgi:hypothetical protein